MNVPSPLRALIFRCVSVLAVVAAAFLAWQGAGLARSARDALARRWEDAFADKVPTAPDPALTAGPIPARGLLLHDDTAARPSPEGGKPTSIGRRQFVRVLNLWPPRGEPTHYRVGKDDRVDDRPYGWVASDDLLRWDTRLVVRPSASRLPLADRPGDNPEEAPVAVGVPLDHRQASRKAGRHPIARELQPLAVDGFFAGQQFE